MLAFNYAAGVFVITAATYIVMCLIWGKAIIESLPYALFLGFALGVITLISSIFLLHKKHIKVYELKDNDGKK